MVLKLVVLLITCFAIAKGSMVQLAEKEKTGAAKGDSSELGQLTLLRNRPYNGKSRSSRAFGRSKSGTKFYKRRPPKKAINDMGKIHSLCENEPDIFPRLPGTGYGGNVLKKKFGGVINKQGEASRKYFGNYKSVLDSPSLKSIRNQKKKSRIDSEFAKRSQRTKTEHTRGFYERSERFDKRPFRGGNKNERSDKKPFGRRSSNLNQGYNKNPVSGKRVRFEQPPRSEKTYSRYPRSEKSYSRNSDSRGKPFGRRANGKTEKLENKPRGTRTGAHLRNENEDKFPNRKKKKDGAYKKDYGKVRKSKKDLRPKLKSIKKTVAEERPQRRKTKTVSRTVTEAGDPQKVSSIFDDIPLVEEAYRKQEAERDKKTENKKRIREENKKRRIETKSKQTYMEATFKDQKPTFEQNDPSLIPNNAKVFEREAAISQSYSDNNAFKRKVVAARYFEPQDNSRMLNRMEMSQGSVPINNGHWMPPQPMLVRERPEMYSASQMNMQHRSPGAYGFGPSATSYQSKNSAKGKFFSDSDDSSSCYSDTYSDTSSSDEKRSYKRSKAKVADDSGSDWSDDSDFSEIDNEITSMPIADNSTDTFGNATNTTDSTFTTDVIPTTTSFDEELFEELRKMRNIRSL